MRNKVMALLALTPTASAQSTTEPLGYAAFILGILALTYSYHLTSGKNGLEAQIMRERAALKRLRAEIAENRNTLERQRAKAVTSIDKISEEMRKTEESVGAGYATDGLKKGYWTRLEQMGGGKPAGSELDRLSDEKTEIQNMIELTKEKYHTRTIDQQSFSNITEEYQKRLIEIEARIKKLKEAEDGG